MLNDVFVVI